MDLPFLEFLAMRVAFHAVDHEVCQMTVFVRDDVEEPVLIGSKTRLIKFLIYSVKETWNLLSSSTTFSASSIEA